LKFTLKTFDPVHTRKGQEKNPVNSYQNNQNNEFLLIPGLLLWTLIVYDFVDSPGLRRAELQIQQILLL
jgi:hypothetical protein